MFKKNGADLIVLARPEENVRLGDYLSIQDMRNTSSLLVQVFDEGYLEFPGIHEEVIRDELMRIGQNRLNFDPMNLDEAVEYIQDLRVLTCKIRGSIQEQIFSSDYGFLPSRSRSKVIKLKIADLVKFFPSLDSTHVELGSTPDGETFQTPISSLDGRLNIITGKKGSGKSHLAKLLISKLGELGAYVVVLDLNNEYGGLAKERDEHPSRFADKVITITPAENLKFTLKYLGRGVFQSLLQNVLDIPHASLREFGLIWNFLEKQGSLDIDSLNTTVRGWRCNELVRDALTSRVNALESSGLFTCQEEQGLRLERLISTMRNGAVLIVNLAKVSSLARRIVVEILLSKVKSLLWSNLIPPLFIFAEEAHLYLRETYWDDIITRMRHLGVFLTFITNQPDAIDATVFRHADNIFLFNFTNDIDIERIAAISSTDVQTVRSIVRSLPQGSCLVLGKATHELPMVLRVASPNLQTMGETKRFFDLGSAHLIGGSRLTAEQIG